MAKSGSPAPVEEFEMDQRPSRTTDSRGDLLEPAEGQIGVVKSFQVFSYE